MKNNDKGRLRVWLGRVGAAASISALVAVTAATSAGAVSPARVQSFAIPALPAAAQVLPAASSLMPMASAQLVTFDQQMIKLVNQARAAAGVSPLTEARGLTQLAVWWSAQETNGATGYNLAHNPNAWTMLTSYGAANRTSWGENVAWSSSTASTAPQIFTAYMNSPGHKANILSKNYRYIGMGTTSGSHGLFNTTEFSDAVQAGQAVVAAAPAPAKGAPVSSLRDGDFIRDASTHQMYRMAGGAPLYVTSWAPFGGGKALKTVLHSDILRLPRYPRDGTYIRSARSTSVFQIVGGAPVFVSVKFPLPKTAKIIDVDPAAINRAGQASVWIHLRALPADGTFIRTPNDGMYYRIAGGAPIWVQSWSTYGGAHPFQNVDPNSVAHGGMPGVWSHLNLIPANDTYIQGSGASKIYRVIHGHPYPIKSWASVGGVKRFTMVPNIDIVKAGTGGKYNHLR